MCGIAGYIAKSGAKISAGTIERLLQSLHHRGPDGDGYHQTETAAIGNARLSIIDIALGWQPFYSDDRKVSVVQNGEIYNYIEVRNELTAEGVVFNTNSDTEVILRAYEYYGEKFVQRLNGMFAIAILDERAQKLLLYRDRLGVKPLYLYDGVDGIYFASEIKALKTLDSFDDELNYQAIYHYLGFNYVPLPETIFKKVSHLGPGSVSIFDLRTGAQDSRLYWELKPTEIDGIGEDALTDEIQALIEDATTIRLRSDVEVGCFLSGGLDSSVVATVAAKAAGKGLRCFTIDMVDPEYSELKYAQTVATLNKSQLLVKAIDRNLFDSWSSVLRSADQPHGDTSFLAQNELCRFASQSVRVALTGDGGDELFAGYDKYKSLEEQGLDNYLSHSLLAPAEDIFRLFTQTRRKTLDIEDSAYAIVQKELRGLKSLSPLQAALYFDTRHLLPGNNLIKPDKMGMAHSIELRSPFLDFRLYERLLSIRPAMKIKNGESKYILKKIASRILPKDLLTRKKQTFGIPITHTASGELRQRFNRSLQTWSAQFQQVFDRTEMEKHIRAYEHGEHSRFRLLRALKAFDLWIAS